MSPAAAPELSVVLVTDSLDAIAKVLGSYRDQNDPTRLEMVISVVGGAQLAGEAIRSLGFQHFRLVDGGDGDLQIAEARAVRAATAPLVVFAQAKAYPRPGFVDAILAARASGTWSVIGPSMANANPESAASRATMWVNYGQWMDAPARGPAEDVPGHNSAYDREALLALGPELEESLEAGWQLQTELRARGGRCFLEPGACIAVVNPSRLGELVARFFRLGRRVAAQRRRHWSVLRRLGYAAGAPLIPLVRLARILADGVRRRRDHLEWRLLPFVLLALLASAAGELVGYVFGHGPPSRFVREV